jgi:hypothetical protein
LRHFGDGHFATRVICQKFSCVWNLASEFCEVILHLQNHSDTVQEIYDAQGLIVYWLNMTQMGCVQQVKVANQNHTPHLDLNEIIRQGATGHADRADISQGFQSWHPGRGRCVVAEFCSDVITM